MLFEQIINILSILLTLVGLMLCLFRYFEHTRRALSFIVLFFLGHLLSNYYWGVYMLIMLDYPNVSSLLAYAGWNLAFPMLAFMLLELRREEGIRGISPVSFLPVPLNVAQLLLYLQYGGYFNNIWQVFWATVVVCLALDSILYYRRNRSAGTRFPYISAIAFFFITTEFATWTVTCFDHPEGWLDPYNYLSLINICSFLLFPWAVTRTYGR